MEKLKTTSLVTQSTKYKKKLPLILLIIGLVLLVIIIVNWRQISFRYNGWFKPVVTLVNQQISKVSPGSLRDDWVYKGMDSLGDSSGFSKFFSLNSASLSMDSAMPSAMPSASSPNLGFAVGGAKDINNFRANIEKGYLPLPSDITYEGLFYDYYFDTGQQLECQKLFCPSYATAVSNEPISSQDEYYLSVGLNSGLKEVDFERKKLNLVIVLDISGSMGSPFDKYYYDRFGRQQNIEESDIVEVNESKLEVAAKSVVALLDQLSPDDRLGIVLFDHSAYLAKPLNLVGETDLEAIKNHILEITEQGGTEMSAGIKTGTELYAEYLNEDKSEYENRMIFLTDAMPNLGETSEEGLLGLTKKNADNGIYTTFIGIGVDFNTELVEAVTKISGANYHSVHSAEEFRKKLTDEFEFMVTPLVFDLKLTLNSSDFVIEKVYGSPEANEATGEIMKVNTLFPSQTENGETRGGLILLKLKKIGTGNSLVLKTSYLDRQGVAGMDEISVNFKNEPHYFNTGIRKGITLVRYTNLIKNWLIDMRKEKFIPIPDVMPVDFYSVNRIDGLSRPYSIEITLGEWERQSIPLSANSHYATMFRLFSDYYNIETVELADKDMDQEKPILEKLIRVLSGD